MRRRERNIEGERDKYNYIERKKETARERQREKRWKREGKERQNTANYRS